MRQYYALLPDNLDVAWTKLGPAQQARNQNSESVYANYWDKFSDITVVGEPRQAGADEVQVTIQYVDDGVRYQENHTIGLIVGADGQLLINSDPGVPRTRIG